MSSTRQLAAEIDEFAIKINSDMRFLMRVFDNKSNTSDSYLAQRTVNSIIEKSPLLITRHAGPYLLKYAEQIKTGDDEFFMNTSFEGDVKSNDIVDDTAKVMKYINMVKSVYQICDEEEKNMIKEKVSDILSNYCQYQLIINRSDTSHR